MPQSLTPFEPVVLCDADLDAHVRRRLNQLVESARAHFDTGLLAVVLGGSLARGQGMGLRRSGGTVVLLSDIDLYFVVSERIPCEVVAEFLSHSIAELRGDPRLLAPPDLAIVDENHFRHGNSNLVRSQLRHGSRFLWPREPTAAASLRRAWSLDVSQDIAITTEDAQRLVLNRCTEWWLFDGEDPCLAAAHRMKQWIDAPLSWLASAGRYHPSRREQFRTLADLRAELPAEAQPAWVAGVAAGRDWVEQVRHQVIDEQELMRAAHWSAAGSPLGDPVRQWVWPFVRCAWQSEAGTTLDALRRAFVMGPPRHEDRVLAVRWLRRGSVASRLRRARRWAPLAPRRLKSWWRYAGGGTGVERLWVACAWAYAGLDGGRELLQGLSGFGPVEDDPRDWARWWAEWFLGKGRR